MTAIINDFTAIRGAIAGCPEGAAGDEKILAKFRAWCDARRAGYALPPDDEASEAALDVADEHEDALFAIPAMGATGLAVKMFLWLRQHDDLIGGLPEDPCAAVPVESLDPRTPWERMLIDLMRDLASLVPELAPLCESVLAP